MIMYEKQPIITHIFSQFFFFFWFPKEDPEKMIHMQVAHLEVNESTSRQVGMRNKKGKAANKWHRIKPAT